jgi:hypothetical protein
MINNSLVSVVVVVELVDVDVTKLKYNNYENKKTN